MINTRVDNIFFNIVFDTQLILFKIVKLKTLNIHTYTLHIALHIYLNFIILCVMNTRISLFVVILYYLIDPLFLYFLQVKV